MAADRSVLRAAIARAIDSGIVVVAAMPARGEPAYPAAYPPVIGGTGDARCGLGEISVLVVRLTAGTPAEAVIDALRAMARHVGPERRREPYGLA